MGRVLHWTAEGLLRRTPSFLILLLFPVGCATFTPIRSPEKGSLENPICTSSVHEQRQFLRRLRFSDGARLSYERQAPVLSPERRILDPYHVWPDKGELSGPLAIVTESGPGVVPETRLLYFELSATACTGVQTPYGFSLEEKE